MAFLQDILRAWRTHGTMKQLYELFNRMLELCQQEYVTATAVWRGERTEPEVRESLRGDDKQVNQLQRDIRGVLVRHLSVGSGESVPAALVFMSIIKDAERLGDYSENIARVRRYVADVSGPPRYAAPIRELLDQCLSHFEMTRQAFRADDAELATKVILDTKEVRVRCDQLLEQILTDEQLTDGRVAAAFALATRYCKRVSAHLKNVCTAVVAPIEFLDYSRKGLAAREEL